MLSRDTPHKNAYIKVLQEAYQKQIFEKLLPYNCLEEFPTQAEATMIKKHILQKVATFRKKNNQEFFLQLLFAYLCYDTRTTTRKENKNGSKIEAVMKLPLNKPYLLEKEVASIFPTFTGEPMFLISVPTSFHTGSSFLQWPHQGA